MTMILSIDGGGCLGCGPLRLLAQLEADGVNIHDDILAGTSVGGLLVLLRATGRTWMSIEQEFTKWAPQIFADAPWWWKADPTRPKYQDDGILAATKALFGDKKCGDAEIPFFVTSFDFQQGRSKIWDNTDDARLADVALRTAAAPTYFQPRESRWADGGLVANNPSVIGIAGALHKLEKPLGQLSVLSLATGGDFWVNPQVGRRTTVLGWAKPVISAQMDGGEERDEFVADQLLGGRHLRVDPACQKAFAMDALGSMQEFRNLWQTAYLRRKPDILNLIQTGAWK